jgi:hypothetical protein
MTPGLQFQAALVLTLRMAFDVEFERSWLDDNLDCALS